MKVETNRKSKTESYLFDMSGYPRKGTSKFMRLVMLHYNGISKCITKQHETYEWKAVFKPEKCKLFTQTAYWRQKGSYGNFEPNFCLFFLALPPPPTNTHTHTHMHKKKKLKSYMHVENFPLTPLLRFAPSAAKKWLCNNLDNNYESSYFNSLEWPAESAWSIVVENWFPNFGSSRHLV